MQIRCVCYCWVDCQVLRHIYFEKILSLEAPYLYIKTNQHIRPHVSCIIYLLLYLLNLKTL